MERYRHFSLMLATLVHSCPGARTTGGRGTAKVPEFCSARAFRETLQVLGEWEALSRHDSDISSTGTLGAFVLVRMSIQQVAGMWTYKYSG